MKNIRKSLFSIVFVCSLCSCGTKMDASSKESVDSSDASSISSDVEVKTKELTSTMLDEVSYGISVESQIVRSSITDNGEVQIVMYNSCYLDYEATLDEYSYRLYSEKYDDGMYSLNDPIPYENIAPSRNNISLMKDYTVDKDGMLIDKSLTIDNKLVETYGRLDGTTSDKTGISFATAGLYDFFAGLQVSDFKNGAVDYSFVLDTTNIDDPSVLETASKALTAGTSDNSLQSLTIYTDGKHITSYEATMVPTVNTDLVPGYTYTFGITVKGNIVSYGADDPKVNAHFIKAKTGEKISALESLFESLKAGNYTEKVVYSYRDDDEVLNQTYVNSVDQKSKISILYTGDGETTETSAYLYKTDNRIQKLKKINGHYYKDGDEVLNSDNIPDFNISSLMFTEADGKYSFSSLYSGVSSFMMKTITSTDLNGNISSLTIDLNDSKKAVINVNSNHSSCTIEFSDIGTTDNKLDEADVKNVDELTYKDLLSDEDYKTATSLIDESTLDMIPTLGKGYSTLTCSTYNSELRIDYAIGNWYDLFDDDGNHIPSSKENEKYYTFRDELFSYYALKLTDASFAEASYQDENSHHVSFSTSKTVDSKTLSVSVKFILGDTNRDITYRVSISLK